MKRNLGLSLTELMVSISLGIFLLGGIVSVFASFDESTDDTLQQGELQDNVRFALDFLSQDISQAGFYSHFSGQSFQSAVSVSLDTDIPAFSTDCNDPSANNASLPNVASSQHFRQIWGDTLAGTSALNCISDAKAGSELIQLKRLFGNLVIDAETDDDTGDGVLTAADLPRTTRLYTLLNSNQIAFFTGSDLSMPQYDEVKIGEVWEYQHRVYYVANVSRYGTSIPVLKRMVLKTHSGIPRMEAEELVEGIEAIHFMYGLDTDDDGVPNRYLTESAMTNFDWDGVNGVLVAVKVYILARSLFPDARITNEMTYQMANQSKTPGPDHYRRLLMQTTVQLKNKV